MRGRVEAYGGYAYTRAHMYTCERTAHRYAHIYENMHTARVLSHALTSASYIRIHDAYHTHIHVWSVCIYTRTYSRARAALLRAKLNTLRAALICAHSHDRTFIPCRARARSHLRTRRCQRAHVPEHRETYDRSHTYATYANAHILVHEYPPSNAPMHARAYTYIHVHKRTYTYIHVHTRTYTYIHVHTRTCTGTHTHTHIDIYIDIRILTPTHLRVIMRAFNVSCIRVCGDCMYAYVLCLSVLVCVCARRRA